MGNCNCKKGRGTLNNIDNRDYIEQALTVVETITDVKPIEDLTELDKVEIMTVYSLLYPRASAVPSIEDAITNINLAIDLYGRKYKR